jgi:tRNA(Phe) wybutosine-synthesizing methylase Tyw3
VLDEYTSEQWSKAVGDTKLAEYVRKYQDPKQADTIMKVQQELDETKIVLVSAPPPLHIICDGLGLGLGRPEERIGTRE